MNYYIIFASILNFMYVTTSSEAIKPTDVLHENENDKVIKGVNVRKGTVAATVKNISKLNTLILNNGDHEEIAKIIEEQRPLCKGLWALDLTELQPIHLWINDSKQPGRTLVAAVMLQECPQLMTKEIKEYIQDIRETLHPLLQKETDKLF